MKPKTPKKPNSVISQLSELIEDIEAKRRETIIERRKVEVWLDSVKTLWHRDGTATPYEERCEMQEKLTNIKLEIAEIDEELINLRQRRKDEKIMNLFDILAEICTVGGHEAYVEQALARFEEQEGKISKLIDEYEK